MSTPFEDSLLDKLRRVEMKAQSVSNEVVTLGDHTTGSLEALSSRLSSLEATVSEIALTLTAINSTIAGAKDRTDAIVKDLNRNGMAHGA